MEDKPKRRWCMFSIREIALLLVAIGFALAWYREHQFYGPLREAADAMDSVRDGRFSYVHGGTDDNGVKIDWTVTPSHLGR